LVRLVDAGDRLEQVGRGRVPARLATALLEVGEEARLGLFGRERVREGDDDLEVARRLALVPPRITERGNRARIAELFELGDRALRLAWILELLRPGRGLVRVVRTASNGQQEASQNESLHVCSTTCS